MSFFSGSLRAQFIACVCCCVFHEQINSLSVFFLSLNRKSNVPWSTPQLVTARVNGLCMNYIITTQVS